MHDRSRTDHRFPVRIYFEDTDAGGIVYHASYLRFAERARTELLRTLGLEHTTLLAENGVVFAVRSCHADYLKPARLDDRLDVVTALDALGGASISLTQTVWRDAEEMVRLRLRIACMTQDGRPVRLPAVVRTALLSLVPPERP